MRTLSSALAHQRYSEISAGLTSAVSGIGPGRPILFGPLEYAVSASREVAGSIASARNVAMRSRNLKSQAAPNE